MEWQPIDTAPKDGTKILVYSPDMSPYPSAAHWGFSDDEWVEWTTSDWCNPTHWMPMPTPPTNKGPS